MNLENTELSERSQSQRTTYGMIPLCELSRIGTSIVTESRLVEEFKGNGGGGMTAKGYEVFIWGDENLCSRLLMVMITQL